jgi:hypothetical protein
LTEALDTRSICFWVYDSDIACYWLHDRGETIDSYDSWPGYFEGREPDPSGGSVDKLLTFCPQNTPREVVEDTLATEAVFADDIVSRLAELIGIDPSRAVTDYRDLAGETSGPGPATPPAFPAGSPLGGTDADLTAAVDLDPQEVEMVAAAAEGDTEKIRQLAADRVRVAKPAPIPLPGEQALAGMGLAIGQAMPQVAMTPLHAAVIYGRVAAAELLLDLAADPNDLHPMFGSALHVAAGNGDANLVQLLLSRGADPGLRNAQGQTPLEQISSSRASLQRLVDVQAAMKEIGMQLPDLVEQLAELPLPTAGWDACEEVLRRHGTD